MRLSKEKKELLREMVYHGKRLYNDNRWWWIADEFSKEGEFDREKDKLYVTIKMARYLLENSLVEYVHYAENYKVTMYGIEAVANKKLVARAERLLKKKSESFHPKRRVYYLVYEDEDGSEVEEVEPIEGSEFCEDCIDKAEEKYKAEYAKESIVPDDTDACDIDYRRDDGESDRFIYCADCGKLIMHPLLLSDDEIKYWLNERGKGPDGELLPQTKYDSQDAYMLTEMLYDHPCEEYTPLLEELAAKIIEVEKGSGK